MLQSNRKIKYRGCFLFCWGVMGKKNTTKRCCNWLIGKLVSTHTRWLLMKDAKYIENTGQQQTAEGTLWGDYGHRDCRKVEGNVHSSQGACQPCSSYCNRNPQQLIFESSSVMSAFDKTARSNGESHMTSSSTGSDLTTCTQNNSQTQRYSIGSLTRDTFCWVQCAYRAQVFQEQSWNENVRCLFPEINLKNSTEFSLKLALVR